MSEVPPVIIKKYANRRLYNTESSSYITLEHLAEKVRQGRDFKVVDAKSGEDITRSVLTQIIVEEESRGQNMLPVSFLRQLIGLYGDSMQAMVPQYLEASMATFHKNQEQLQKLFVAPFSGTLPFSGTAFEKIAEQNMAIMQAASKLFHGRAATAASGQEAAPTSTNSSSKWPRCSKSWMSWLRNNFRRPF